MRGAPNSNATGQASDQAGNLDEATWEKVRQRDVWSVRGPQLAGAVDRTLLHLLTFQEESDMRIFHCSNPRFYILATNYLKP